MRYYLHGASGQNLHYDTIDFEAAKKYADSFKSKVTISTQHNGKSVWNGKPCKVFKEIYWNGKC